MNALARLNMPPAFWRFLAEVRCGDVLRTIARHVPQLGADAFDVAEAVHWIASDYGGSEFDPLRRAANASAFEPGTLAYGPQSEVACLLYNALSHVIAPPHLCEARAEYQRTAGLAAFNVRGAVRTLRNQHATAYVFADGSRFVVGRAGWHRYVGTDGLPYAERIASAVAP